MAYVTLSDNTKIWYELIGNGPLLVLNHGFCSSHKSIQYIADKLKDKFLCLLYDERGQGDSDKPLGDSYKKTYQIYTLEHLADDCFELLNKLNLIKGSNSIFMYGHSMGGMISQIFAIKHSDVLKALALGSTSPRNDNKNMRQILKNHKSGRIPLTYEGFKTNAALGFTKEFRKKSPEFMSMVADDKVKVPRDILISLMENLILNFNTEASLKNLKVPTLIMHGREDIIILYTMGELLHRIIPNSHLTLFPNQNHEINKEIPEIVANKLFQFFLEGIVEK
jgi:pimeloyl-ACP methyl ester carboxylesterase